MGALAVACAALAVTACGGRDDARAERDATVMKAPETVPSAAKGTFPKDWLGTYEKRLTGAGFRVAPGRWRLELRPGAGKNMGFAFLGSPEFRVDAAGGFEFGLLKITGNPTSACPGTGEYTAGLQDGRLRFMKVKDQCSGRGRLLTEGVWRRLGPDGEPVTDAGGARRDNAGNRRRRGRTAEETPAPTATPSPAPPQDTAP